MSFGESGLNFELLVWPTPEAVKRPAAMHAAYTWAIADALERACIEIPLPQTDVRLRGLFGEEGVDAMKALRLDAPAAHPAAGPVATTNDAAEELARPLPDADPEDATSAGSPGSPGR